MYKSWMKQTQGIDAGFAVKNAIDHLVIWICKENVLRQLRN